MYLLGTGFADGTVTSFEGIRGRSLEVDKACPEQVHGAPKDPMLLQDSRADGSNLKARKCR